MNAAQRLLALRGKAGPMLDRRTKRCRDRGARKRDAIRRSTNDL